MRISRDKVNKLAHTVADTLAEIDQVGFLEDRNTIRQEARKALEVLLDRGGQDRYIGAAEDCQSAQDHPGRLAGVGDSVSQILQRRSTEAGHLSDQSAFLSQSRSRSTLLEQNQSRFVLSIYVQGRRSLLVASTRIHGFRGTAILESL